VILACFFIVDADIVAYAFVVVVDVPSTATVAAAPSLHVTAGVAHAFARVDDVAVSYRN
jgi:hypothetical protein